MNIESFNKPGWIFFNYLLASSIGIIDAITGYELALSLFYLFPISLITWNTNKIHGFSASVFCSILWYWADQHSGHVYTHHAIAYWNTGIRFGFFTVVTLLLSALKQALEHERELSRSDFLTGAINSRFFYQLLQMEMNRCQRSGKPMTIAYLDLDNFKWVNDNHGHSVGDTLLINIARNAKSNLRISDFFARLGGDEFAVLLPDTDEKSARIALHKLQGTLLEEMNKHNWPVTFSIGTVTCHDIPKSVDELIKQADNLMYSVKNHGKNSIEFSIYRST